VATMMSTPADRGVVCESLDVLVDLRRQLAGGGEDQGTGAAATAAGHPLQDRQHEGGSLAASGHGAREHVLKFEKFTEISFFLRTHSRLDAWSACSFRLIVGNGRLAGEAAVQARRGPRGLCASREDLCRSGRGPPES